MRTAARIALALTGTAILMAAMATAGACAGGRPIDTQTLRAIARDTAADRPRRQPAPCPEELPGYAHAEIFAALSNIARLFEFPELTIHADERKNRSIWSALDVDALDRLSLDRLSLDRLSLDRPSRSRGAFPNSLVDISRGCLGCASGGNPENARRARKVADIEEETLRARQRKSAPIVLKFEAVININLAGLGW